jgi:hypothetical protein
VEVNDCSIGEFLSKPGKTKVNAIELEYRLKRAAAIQEKPDITFKLLKMIVCLKIEVFEAESNAVPIPEVVNNRKIFIPVGRHTDMARLWRRITSDMIQEKVVARLIESFALRNTSEYIPQEGRTASKASGYEDRLVHECLLHMMIKA